MLASTLSILPRGQEISTLLRLQESRRGNGGYGCRLGSPCSLRSMSSWAVATRMFRIGARSCWSPIATTRVAGNADQALQHFMIRPIQILILCHTIPSESAENLLSVARTLQPVVKILLLSTGHRRLINISATRCMTHFRRRCQVPHGGQKHCLD